MISAYVVFLSVWGMVLSYVWLIHHFWLRHVFMPAEDNLQHQPTDVGESAARGVAMADVAEGKKMEPAHSFA